jgi:hypothetical protein
MLQEFAYSGAPKTFVDKYLGLIVSTIVLQQKLSL